MSIVRWRRTVMSTWYWLKWWWSNHWRCTSQTCRSTCCCASLQKTTSIHQSNAEGSSSTRKYSNKKFVQCKFNNNISSLIYIYIVTLLTLSLTFLCWLNSSCCNGILSSCKQNKRLSFKQAVSFWKCDADGLIYQFIENWHRLEDTTFCQVQFTITLQPVSSRNL